ncbi:hypothetical protein KY310_04170 [Candidatus Woesearchaeota archaeon]|nr:hypothetical protein [Candidatus Woesearchaeota archaeon]
MKEILLARGLAPTEFMIIEEGLGQAWHNFRESFSFVIHLGRSVYKEEKDAELHNAILAAEKIESRLREIERAIAKNAEDILQYGDALEDMDDLRKGIMQWAMGYMTNKEFAAMLNQLEQQERYADDPFAKEEIARARKDLENRAKAQLSFIMDQTEAESSGRFDEFVKEGVGILDVINLPYIIFHRPWEIESRQKSAWLDKAAREGWRNFDWILNRLARQGKDMRQIPTGMIEGLGKDIANADEDFELRDKYAAVVKDWLRQNFGMSEADFEAITKDSLVAFGIWWNAYGSNFVKDVQGTLGRDDVAQAAIWLGDVRREVDDYVGAARDYQRAADVGVGRIASVAAERKSAVEFQENRKMNVQFLVQMYGDPLNWIPAVGLVGVLAKSKIFVGLINKIKRLFSITEGVSRTIKTKGVLQGRNVAGLSKKWRASIEAKKALKRLSDAQKEYSLMRARMLKLQNAGRAVPQAMLTEFDALKKSVQTLEGEMLIARSINQNTGFVSRVFGRHVWGAPARLQDDIRNTVNLLKEAEAAGLPTRVARLKEQLITLTRQFDAAKSAAISQKAYAAAGAVVSAIAKVLRWMDRTNVEDFFRRTPRAARGVNVKVNPAKGIVTASAAEGASSAADDAARSIGQRAGQLDEGRVSKAAYAAERSAASDVGRAAPEISGAPRVSSEGFVRATPTQVEVSRAEGYLNHLESRLISAEQAGRLDEVANIRAEIARVTEYMEDVRAGRQRPDFFKPRRVEVRPGEFYEEFVPGWYADESGSVFGVENMVRDVDPERLRALKPMRDVVATPVDEVTDVAVSIGGTGAQSKTHLYPGDVDFGEFVVVRAADDAEFGRIMAGKTQETLRKSEDAGMTFTELKVGSKKVEISPGVFEEISGANKWNREEVLRGYKEVVDSQGRTHRITLESAFSVDGPRPKMDWVAPVDGSYREISKVMYPVRQTEEGVYQFKYTGVETAWQDVYMSEREARLAERMSQVKSSGGIYNEAAIDEFFRVVINDGIKSYGSIDHPNYLKAAKRLYTRYTASGDYAKAEALAPLFRSGVVHANQINDELEALGGLLRQGARLEGRQLETAIDQIQGLKGRLLDAAPELGLKYVDDFDELTDAFRKGDYEAFQRIKQRISQDIKDHVNAKAYEFIVNNKTILEDMNALAPRFISGQKNVYYQAPVRGVAELPITEQLRDAESELFTVHSPETLHVTQFFVGKLDDKNLVLLERFGVQLSPEDIARLGDAVDVAIKNMPSREITMTGAEVLGNGIVVKLDKTAAGVINEEINKVLKHILRSKGVPEDQLDAVIRAIDPFSHVDDYIPHMTLGTFNTAALSKDNFQDLFRVYREKGSLSADDVAGRVEPAFRGQTGAITDELNELFGIVRRNEDSVEGTVRIDSVDLVKSTQSGPVSLKSTEFSEQPIARPAPTEAVTPAPAEAAVPAVLEQPPTPAITAESLGLNPDIPVPTRGTARVLGAQAGDTEYYAKFLSHIPDQEARNAEYALEEVGSRLGRELGLPVPESVVVDLRNTPLQNTLLVEQGIVDDTAVVSRRIKDAAGDIGDLERAEDITNLNEVKQSIALRALMGDVDASTNTGNWLRTSDDRIFVIDFGGGSLFSRRDLAEVIEATLPDLLKGKISFEDVEPMITKIENLDEAVFRNIAEDLARKGVITESQVDEMVDTFKFRQQNMRDAFERVLGRQPAVREAAPQLPPPLLAGAQPGLDSVVDSAVDALIGNEKFNQPAPGRPIPVVSTSQARELSDDIFDILKNEPHMTDQDIMARYNSFRARLGLEPQSEFELDYMIDHIRRGYSEAGKPGIEEFLISVSQKPGKKVFLGSDGFFNAGAYEMMFDEASDVHYISRRTLATEDELKRIQQVVYDDTLWPDEIDNLHDRWEWCLKGQYGWKNSEFADLPPIRLYKDLKERITDVVMRNMGPDGKLSVAKFDSELGFLFDDLMLVPENRQKVIQEMARFIGSYGDDLSEGNSVIVIDQAGTYHAQPFMLREGKRWINENWGLLSGEEKELLGGSVAPFRNGKLEMQIGYTQVSPLAGVENPAWGQLSDNIQIAHILEVVKSVNVREDLLISFIKGQTQNIFTRRPKKDLARLFLNQLVVGNEINDFNRQVALAVR